MPPWGWCIVAPIGYAIFWTWLIWVIAHFSGWSNLARYYRTNTPFHGTIRRFRSAKMGWSNYGGCLTIGTNAEGLYLAVFFLFRPGHSPLFIPWADVRATVVRGWLTTGLEIRFEKFPMVSLRISPKLGQQIAADANHVWAHTNPS